MDEKVSSVTLSIPTRGLRCAARKSQNLNYNFNDLDKILIIQMGNKKDVNRDSHIASSPISQSSFFKGVRCLILASTQRKLRGYVEFL